jgi:hypothetical protein
MGDLTIDKVITTVFGNKRITFGRAAGSGTGGEINTQLRVCEHICLTANLDSVVADAVTLNETLPIAGSAVTIIHTSGVGYIYFMAVGY